MFGDWHLNHDSTTTAAAITNDATAQAAKEEEDHHQAEEEAPVVAGLVRLTSSSYSSALGPPAAAEANEAEADAAKKAEKAEAQAEEAEANAGALDLDALRHAVQDVEAQMLDLFGPYTPPAEPDEHRAAAAWRLHPYLMGLTTPVLTFCDEPTVLAMPLPPCTIDARAYLRLVRHCEQEIAAGTRVLAHLYDGRPRHDDHHNHNHNHNHNNHEFAAGGEEDGRKRTLADARARVRKATAHLDHLVTRYHPIDAYAFHARMEALVCKHRALLIELRKREALPALAAGEGPVIL